MAANTVRTTYVASAPALLSWQCSPLSLSARAGRGGTSTSVKAHAAGVQSVNFSADGRFLLTAGDDKAVKVSGPSRFRKLVAEDVTQGCCQCFGRSGACPRCSS